jgi:hypothetical protein
MSLRPLSAQALGASLFVATSAAAQASPANGPSAAPACFERAYNQKDAVALTSCFADTVRVYSVTPDTVRVLIWTQQDVRATYERIFAHMPKARQVTLDTIAQGPYLVARERLEEITPGVAGTGLSVYRVRGGKITGLWAFSEP